MPNAGITAQKRAEKELGRLNQVLAQRVDERTRLAEDRAGQLQEFTEELIEFRKNPYSGTR